MKPKRLTTIALWALLGWCLSSLSPWAQADDTDATRKARERMVQRHIIERDIKDKRVIEAMRAVPRHEFVPAAQRARAYEDISLPIGNKQTITSPYEVAFMTEKLRPSRPTGYWKSAPVQATKPPSSPAWSRRSIPSKS